MNENLDIVTDDVKLAIASENDYQKSRWDYNPPGREHDDRSLDEWILYMEEYMAKARAESTSANEIAAVHTIRKVVTMGIHVLRKHGAPQRFDHEMMITKQGTITRA